MLNGRVDTCPGIPEIVKTHFVKNTDQIIFQRNRFVIKKSKIIEKSRTLAENGEFRFDRSNNGWADDSKRRTNLVWKP